MGRKKRKKSFKVGGSWKVFFKNGTEKTVNAKTSRQAVFKARGKRKLEVKDVKYQG